MARRCTLYGASLGLYMLSTPVRALLALSEAENALISWRTAERLRGGLDRLTQLRLGRALSLSCPSISATTSSRAYWGRSASISEDTPVRRSRIASLAPREGCTRAAPSSVQLAGRRLALSIYRPSAKLISLTWRSRLLPSCRPILAFAALLDSNLSRQLSPCAPPTLHQSRSDAQSALLLARASFVLLAVRA